MPVPCGTDVTHWTDLVRPLVAGRRLILTGGPLAGLATRVQQLHDLGAPRPFLLATVGMGTGPLPTE